MDISRCRQQLRGLSNRQARVELVKLQREQLKMIDLLEKGLRIPLAEKRLKKAGRV